MKYYVKLKAKLLGDVVVNMFTVVATTKVDY